MSATTVYTHCGYIEFACLAMYFSPQASIRRAYNSFSGMYTQFQKRLIARIYIHTRAKSYSGLKKGAPSRSRRMLNERSNLNIHTRRSSAAYSLLTPNFLVSRDNVPASLSLSLFEIYESYNCAGHTMGEKFERYITPLLALLDYLCV